MPSMRLAIPAVLMLAWPAFGQETYKAETMKGAPPEGIPAAVRKELAEEGVRILTGEGKPFAEVWIRKAAGLGEALRRQGDDPVPDPGGGGAARGRAIRLRGA